MQTTNTTETKLNPQDFVALADKTYLEYMKNGKYKDIIDGMATLGDYSLRNQMLIMQQCPSATKVNNMNSWNFNKRIIQKGAKSIKILAPVFDSIVTVENGMVSEKKSNQMTGYRLSYVFDISQTTERKNEYDLDKKPSQPIEVKAHYDEIQNELKCLLNSYEFIEAEMESDGIIDTKNHTITINKNLSPEQKLKTTVDQVAAVLVIGRDRSKLQALIANTIPNINAVEISAISNILCKKLGIESSPLIEPDFTEKPDSCFEKFAQNLGVVRSISQRLLETIDNVLDKTLEVQKKTTELTTDEKVKEQPIQEPKKLKKTQAVMG